MYAKTGRYKERGNREYYSFYNNDQDRMYQQMLSCYEKMSATYNMPMIPFGELIQTLRSDRYFHEVKRALIEILEGPHA